MIRASEIGQYDYCARAWWLSSVLGKPSANIHELQRGGIAHQRHGRTVWLARALTIATAMLMIVAAVVLIWSAWKP